MLAPLLGVAPMLFVDGPFHLAGPIAVLVLVAALIALDASSPDLASRSIFLTLFVFPVGYLAYLHRRADDGRKKWVPGVVTLTLFMGACVYGSGAGTKLEAYCSLEDGDVQCELENRGRTIARECVDLVLHKRAGRYEMGQAVARKSVCLRAWPGESTRRIGRPFDVNCQSYVQHFKSGSPPVCWVEVQR